MQLTYSDLMIGSLDQVFIDKIADALDIDYSDAPIFPGYGYIGNQIISYIYSEAIQNLDISDDLKETLTDSIYVNAIDSGLDIDIDNIDANDEEIEIIANFLSIIK